MVVRTVNDALSKLGSSNQLLQGNSMAQGHVPSSPFYNNIGQTSQPPIRMLLRPTSPNQSQSNGSVSQNNQIDNNNLAN